MVPLCWAQRQVSGVCMDLASWGRQTGWPGPGPAYLLWPGAHHPTSLLPPWSHSW